MKLKDLVTFTAFVLVIGLSPSLTRVQEQEFVSNPIFNANILNYSRERSPRVNEKKDPDAPRPAPLGGGR
jgi:hypothetical protein